MICKNSNPKVVKFVREFLQKWTTVYSVTLASLNSLLNFLNNFFPELPHDARTILNSLRIVNTISVAIGVYSHCGLRRGIEKILHQQKKIPVCLQLDIFVDGFPMFKCLLENACWVILGRVHNLDLTVFLIGVNLGKTLMSSRH